MDHTAKLLDVQTGKARQTLRGHVDAVNCVVFQPFTSNLCTGSGDKTVSLWDVRSGLCIQTFYGHTNACSDVAFNLRGDTIASCDSDGVVKVWDVRMIAERATLSDSRHALNSVSFDQSGSIIAAASDDGTVKMFSLGANGGGGESDEVEPSHVCNLLGHEDAVQSAKFSPHGEWLVSGASDCTFRSWQA
jgi:WD40 repeat protein